MGGEKKDGNIFLQRVHEIPSSALSVPVLHVLIYGPESQKGHRDPFRAGMEARSMPKALIRQTQSQDNRKKGSDSHQRTTADRDSFASRTP